MLRRLQKRDDPFLISRTLKGDSLAFRVLIERHHSLVYSVVRGVLGDHHAVDDAVQNVILRIYRGLPNFKGQAKFTSWAFRIARNEALNMARLKQTALVPLECVPDPGHRHDDPESTYWQGIEARNLECALGQLEEKYRVILELFYMGERSYDEISEILDLPMGTVKTYLHRAKAALKIRLERQRLRATG